MKHINKSTCEKLFAANCTENRFALAKCQQPRGGTCARFQDALFRVFVAFALPTVNCQWCSVWRLRGHLIKINHASTDQCHVLHLHKTDVLCALLASESENTAYEWLLVGDVWFSPLLVYSSLAEKSPTTKMFEFGSNLGNYSWFCQDYRTSVYV